MNNNMFDGLPTLGQMFKLVMVLLLAAVAIGIVLLIVKMLMPLLIIGALIVGGIWLFKKVNGQSAAAA